jgi:hypothetical protein
VVGELPRHCSPLLGGLDRRFEKGGFFLGTARLPELKHQLPQGTIGKAEFIGGVFL